MERYIHPDEEPADPTEALNAIPLPDLAEYVKLRHLEAAADEPIVQYIAHSDSLAPLLQMIVGQVVPLI